MNPLAPLKTTQEITKEFIELAGADLVYNRVVARVYGARKLRGVTIEEAIEDDRWRYDELPKQSGYKGFALSKDDLLRLVRWKVTHGIYRPFLKSMIDKNDRTLIEQHLSKAQSKLNDSFKDSHRKTPGEIAADQAWEFTKAALDEVTKIKGVGPATGALVLSVLQPVHVPFFSDELFRWLFPNHDTKLKYNEKEFKMLFDGVQSLIRLHKCKVREVERCAFVCMHSDVLLPEDLGILGVSRVLSTDAVDKNAKFRSEDEKTDTRTGNEKLKTEAKEQNLPVEEEPLKEAKPRVRKASDTVEIETSIVKRKKKG